jgi:hypothetical protein
LGSSLSPAAGDVNAGDAEVFRDDGELIVDQFLILHDLGLLLEDFDGQNRYGGILDRGNGDTSWDRRRSQSVGSRQDIGLAAGLGWEQHGTAEESGAEAHEENMTGLFHGDIEECSGKDAEKAENFLAKWHSPC